MTLHILIVKNNIPGTFNSIIDDYIPYYDRNRPRIAHLGGRTTNLKEYDAYVH